jgi:thioesterase domain-containing protein/acyl carrier protein
VLNKVRDTTFNALSHSELPFELLLEKLNIRSVHGRNPLFQFYLFSQAAFLQPRKVRDLTVRPMPTVGLGTPFELQMGIIERSEGVRLQLEYNADLFDRPTIERILLDFCTILRLLATKLDTRVDEIVLAPPLAGPHGPHPTLSPAATDPAGSSFSDEPQNETEKRLARIWQRLLGIESVGRHHNYFELGGTSLGAVRLFAEIQKECKVQLPLAALFEAQTIAELARLLNKDDSTTGWSSLVPIQTKGSRPPFFCVHGGGGNVLIYRALSNHLGMDQPFYGLQSQGLDGCQPLLTRVEDMAALYVRELQRVQPHGPYFLGGYCMGGTVALEMAQQLRARGEKIALLALFDTANWAEVLRNGFLEKTVYQTERLLFHLRNFGLLDYRRKVEFIKDKLNVLSSRKDVWRGWFTKRFGRQSEFALLARIWEINDQSILDYKPSFYAGTLTDFRPLQQYSQYHGAPMDWGKIVHKHEIVTLPVYPAGMLVEPFVQDLAQALRKSMDANIETPQGQRRASQP